MDNDGRRIPGWLKPFAAIVGPAAVMTAGIMGAGSTTSLVLAGAWFRYDLLWVAIITLPFVVVCLDSGARVGIMSGHKGMLSVIRDETHFAVTWFVFVVMVLFNLFVNMGQMSIMLTSSLAIFGVYPPAEPPAEFLNPYKLKEIGLSMIFIVGMLSLLLTGSYKRAQKMMTALLLFMFACFFIVALRGLQEIGAVLLGLIPTIPENLETATAGRSRESFVALMGIAGGALAAAPILSFSYFTSDDRARREDIPRYFWKAVLNLGVIFGLYSMLVLVAGGYALYPLADHAEIEKVEQAGRVLTNAMPAAVASLGPKIFAAGLFVCALTTMIVVAQLMCYFTLDTLRFDWRYQKENRMFRLLLVFWIAVPGLLAPFWEFPALLKILLLMGVNAIIVPMAIVIIIYLINKRSLMGEYKANAGRNFWLGASLVFSVGVACYKMFFDPNNYVKQISEKIAGMLGSGG